MVVTHQSVLDAFHYDPVTGVLSRRGKAVGFRHGKGYLAVSFQGQRFLVHRLIWFYMTGKWPNTVDHKNRNRSDNRWENLRELTTSENSKQPKAPRGPKGEKNFYTNLLEDIRVSQEVRSRMTRRQVV